ncbi:hypothetical protein H8356DRAFT_1322257 [Neocallimastix lanati (nom. inval.)]|nr:hypothetical protein H8356DRAFT_1322257 [Neocallimastix sp. JGI-2020a]
MGFICLEYKTIKSQITKDINKQLPSDVINYQVLITGTYIKDLNSFYTTSF